MSISFFCAAQKNDKINVLSYYAVSNAIDGQPLIERRNVLRFYPVFALHDSVEFVKVTVYYGNEVSSESAMKFMNGRYWESKLPEFDIGDAIQRYEVEVGIKYNINFKKSLRNYQLEIERQNAQHKKKINNLSSDLDTSIKQLGSTQQMIARAYERAAELTETLDSLNLVFQNAQTSNASCCSSLKTNINLLKERTRSLIDILTPVVAQRDTSSSQNLIALKSVLDSISAVQVPVLIDTTCCKLIPNVPASDAIILRLNSISSGMLELFRTFEEVNFYLNSLNQMSQSITQLLDAEHGKVIQLITSNEYMIDSLKSNLVKLLADKDYAGEGIQKADIIFYDDYERAKLLYRNYRINNRAQVALDPAEKLSIFRIRYVPFPVVDMELGGPSRSGFPVVFEIGVNFGNEVIATNEYMKPELSLKRLGISTAITPKLFAEDAQILALLVTYEFNAYASIGAGYNFGTRAEKGSQTYFSFGINQKAFQRLVSGIANIFQN